MTIYISSTYQDLKDYRGAVDKQLRSMGHKVIAMETYCEPRSALDRCVADVRSVDDDIRVSHIPRLEERKSLARIPSFTLGSLRSGTALRACRASCPSSSDCDTIPSTRKGARQGVLLSAAPMSLRKLRNGVVRCDAPPIEAIEFCAVPRARPFPNGNPTL